MSKSWDAQKALFRSEYNVEREVAGKKLKFYPVSIDLTFRLRDYAPAIASFMSSLKVDTSNDSGTFTENITTKEGESIKRFKTDQISEGMAKLRFEQRRRPVEDFIAKLFGDESRQLVALLIIDSLRDVFDESNTPAWTDFIKVIDIPSTIECIIGVVLANKGVFDPLLKAAGLDTPAAAEVAKAKLKAAVDKVMAPEPPKTPG